VRASTVLPLPVSASGLPLRIAAVVSLTAGAMMSAGCAHLREALGADGKYLFMGQDALCLPGREVRMTVKLVKVSISHEVEAAPIRIFHKDQLLAEGRTDHEGEASFTFRPEKVGDYEFVARYQPLDKPASSVQTQLLLAARPADAALCVVDLDKTLVDSGFRRVLTGDPPPMNHSPRVMNRIAERWTVIYLTSRSEYLGPKTKDWLRKHRFPNGPVLLAETEELLTGNRRYKSQSLARIRRDFIGRGVGIGNKKSDVLAYQENGLEAIYLVRLTQKERRNPPAIREKIHDVKELPGSVQVAMDWRDVEAAIFEDKQLTAYRACRQIAGLLKKTN